MATVFLARQISLNRHVAIKVMKAALSADDEFASRFLKEAHTVASLSHPGIISIYDAGAVEFNSFMAMEYIPGGDLRKKLQSGQANTVIFELANALHHAHENGIVHRDIKPANILFRVDEQAVITDFGVAKAINSGTKMTATGLSIGTPRYMSPEQTRGKEVDGRSDLYSLGIVFYEMLTGTVPFDGQDSFSVGLKHINEPPPKLPAHLEVCQPTLDKLLAKKPLQRYQTAFDLANDLKALVKLATPKNRESSGTRRVSPVSTPSRTIAAAEPSTAKTIIKELPEPKTKVTRETRKKPTKPASANRPQTQNHQKFNYAAIITASIVGIVVLIAASWKLLIPHNLQEPYEHAENGMAEPPAELKTSQEEPSPAAAASTANLKIQTTPEGADVWLAEEHRGETPLSLGAIEHGQYGLVLEHAGFETWSQTITINDDSSNLVDIKLTAVPGRMRISSTPAGADIWIDGEQMEGGTPIELKKMKPGSYDVLLQLASHQQSSTRVTVSSGEMTSVDLTLEPEETISRVDTPAAMETEARSRVTEILASANLYLAEGRLVSDSSQDALEKYQEVLAMDPDNQKAKEGLEEIRTHFVNRIRGALDAEDLQAASEILNTERLIQSFPETFQQYRTRLEQLSQEKEQKRTEIQLVSNIQRELRRLGRDIQVDGVFGDQTSGLVRAFEEASQSETASGLPTAAVLEALESTSNWPGIDQSFSTDCLVCPELTIIPGGSFRMGSPENELGRRNGEGPLRTVEITSFKLGTYPVTFEEWDACVEDGGCSHQPSDMGWGRGDNPVINVHWYDIQEYLEWLHQKTGAVHRLPSEAEWEYAARASTTTRYPTGDCITREQANFNGSSPAPNCPEGERSGRILPVGTHPPNPWGLYDMHGNILEWTADCWEDNYAEVPPTQQARVSGDCTRGVLRGGSWFEVRSIGIAWL